MTVDVGLRGGFLTTPMTQTAVMQSPRRTAKSSTLLLLLTAMLANQGEPSPAVVLRAMSGVVGSQRVDPMGKQAFMLLAYVSPIRDTGTAIRRYVSLKNDIVVV